MFGKKPHLFKVLPLIFLRTRFIEDGCNENLIDELIKLNVIENYKHLYQVFTTLLPGIRENIQTLWQLLCLSGEEKAFSHAKTLGMNTFTATEMGENPFHYAVLSGNPSQVDRVLALNIPWDSTTRDRINGLHYAMLSHSKAQVEKILSLEKQYRKKLDRQSNKGRNILHYAAATGCIDVVEIAIKEVDDLHAQDAFGYNALDYARVNGNQTVTHRLCKAGIKESKQCLLDFDFAGMTLPCHTNTNHLNK